MSWGLLIWLTDWVDRFGRLDQMLGTAVQWGYSGVAWVACPPQLKTDSPGVVWEALPPQPKPIKF